MVTGRVRLRLLAWRVWRSLQGSYLTVGAEGLEDPAGAQCTHVPNYLWRRAGAGQLFGDASSWVGRAPGGTEWIPASGLLRLRAGDVVVFYPSTVGQHGHVDVVLNGSKVPWVGMDQNWPIGSPVSKVRHSRSQVAGVIRVRG